MAAVSSSRVAQWPSHLCTISGNTATYVGGGVFVGGGTDTVAISSCTISGNTAANSAGQGGGVFVSYGTVMIVSSSITGNFALHSGQGGGVYVQGGTVAISSCTISGNSATNVCAHAPKFPSPRWEFLLTCPIDSHLSIRIDIWFYQGYVCASHACKLPIAPMGFSHVSRLCLQGGGVYISSGTVTFSSCTITGNTANYVRAHAQKFPSPQWEDC